MLRTILSLLFSLLRTCLNIYARKRQDFFFLFLTSTHVVRFGRRVRVTASRRAVSSQAAVESGATIVNTCLRSTLEKRKKTQQTIVKNVFDRVQLSVPGHGRLKHINLDKRRIKKYRLSGQR